MEFPPILILAIVWLLIGMLSKAGKVKQQASRNTGADQPPQPRKGQKAGQPKGAEQPAPAAKMPEPLYDRPTVMQPTISVTEHDDSIYQGSMYAETGEGYDPCHDEQMAPLNAVEAAVPAAETAQPGLQLGWTGSDVVRGLVMSEILKRK